MLRRTISLLVAVWLSATFLSLIYFGTGHAATAQQQELPVGEDGEAYVVRPGDSLSRIASRFYNDGTAYMRIVEATNAKAQGDDRFNAIQDPRRIWVGQIIWIPDLSAPAAEEPGRAISFVEPVDGAILPTTFDVFMEAEGLTIEPAGEINENAGHFHILVDTDFAAPGDLIPFDDGYFHFGGGQVTTTLALEPGEHILRLQFADGAHRALDGPEYRDEITVTVSENAVPSTSAESAPIQVRFVEPADGATLPETFDVAMAAEGLTIEPAGEINENAGHFHILVDTDFIAPGDLIPFDDGYFHFGGGQVTTTLALEPGEHILRLQFADGAHRALDGPEYRDEITVTVSENEVPSTSAESAPIQVRFVEPADGATLPETFDVAMAAEGLTIEPAGEINENAGHFHILVDTDFVAPEELIPFEEGYFHFGGGQITTTLTLEPGEHILRLQFADGAHRAQDGPEYRDEVIVTIAPDGS